MLLPPTEHSTKISAMCEARKTQSTLFRAGFVMEIERSAAEAPPDDEGSGVRAPLKVSQQNSADAELRKVSLWPRALCRGKTRPRPVGYCGKLLRSFPCPRLCAREKSVSTSSQENFSCACSSKARDAGALAVMAIVLLLLLLQNSSIRPRIKTDAPPSFVSSRRTSEAAPLGPDPSAAPDPGPRQSASG